MSSSPRNSTLLRLATHLACLFPLLGGSIASAAEYRFTPEPAYTQEAAEEIYKPLLEYLGKATGEKFVLTPPANYSTYWRQIREPDNTDFSYDEAHFADYRIQHSKFIPLVRRLQPTSYTLLASPYFEGETAKDLENSRIATMPAPSMGYALLAEIFPDPVQQPEIKSSAASWRECLDILNSDEADAMIFPTWMLETFGNPSHITVFTSKEMAGPAILASPNVPEDVRNKVRDALLNVDGAPELGELLLELGVTKFVPATAADYEGNQEMLSGFYGYK